MRGFSKIAKAISRTIAPMMSIGVVMACSPDVHPDHVGVGGTGAGDGGAATVTTTAISSTTTTVGTGGTGGAAPQSKGRSSADFVAAGNRSSSSTRMAISSLGQSPGANGISRSAKYQLIGGLVAATQP